MGDITRLTTAGEAALRDMIADAEQALPTLSFSGLRTHYERFCETCSRPLVHGEQCGENCTIRTLDTKTAVAEGIYQLHLM